MKHALAIVVSLFSLINCLFAQIDSAVHEIELHRKKQEDKFRDPKTSPLEKKHRKNYKEVTGMEAGY